MNKTAPPTFPPVFCCIADSYFVANVYPFYSILYNNVDLNFTTFKGTHGFYDHGLYYQNLFDAMLDSVVWAIEKSGFPQLPITGEGFRFVLVCNAIR